MKYPLVSDRISLRPLELQDLDEFLRYRQDPAIAKYQSWEPNYSLEQAKQLIESQVGIDFPEPDSWLQIGIHLKTTGELVGDLALHTLQQADCYEMGFTLAQKNQRKGYAKEAAARLIEELVVLGAVQIIATPDSRNASSIKLLKALGFAEQPAKSWVEEFKGEQVQVLHFELGFNPLLG